MSRVMRQISPTFNMSYELMIGNTICLKSIKHCSAHHILEVTFCVIYLWEAIFWPQNMFCDILANISDCRRTLTVEAWEEGQVRGQRRQRFEMKVVIFSLTYEFFDSTILRLRDTQLTGEIVAPNIWAPSHLNSKYNLSSTFTKILFGRKFWYIKFWVT